MIRRFSHQRVVVLLAERADGVVIDRPGPADHLEVITADGVADGDLLPAPSAVRPHLEASAASGDEQQGKRLNYAHSLALAMHTKKRRVNARRPSTFVKGYFASFACLVANRWILRYAPPMKISLVIPCYNEEESLPYLVQEIDEVIDAAGLDAEVILVDDGSADRTAEMIAAQAHENPQAVIFRRNHGQTAAVWQALTRDRVGHRPHADLQKPSERDTQTARQARRVRRGQRLAKGSSGQSARKLPSRMANWLIGKIGGVPLHDYGCSLKAYRRDVIENVRLYGRCTASSRSMPSGQGARVTELPANAPPCARAGTSNTVWGRPSRSCSTSSWSSS